MLEPKLSAVAFQQFLDKLSSQSKKIKERKQTKNPQEITILEIGAETWIAKKEVMHSAKP